MLAVATRRPVSILLVFVGVALACWGFSAIADVKAANEMAGIFMMFIVFSGIGQHGFRRRLAALEDERAEVLTGEPGKENPTHASDPDATSNSVRKKPSRNPRSAAFLGASNPGAHLAAEVTAVLMWGLLILLCSRSTSVDWFGDFGLAPKLLVATVVAALAFERVGYHQVVSRRVEEISRIRRELARERGLRP